MREAGRPTRRGRELGAQNIRPHAIHSQSEARDLLARKGAQGGPLVIPNDTRIAQDSHFRVICLQHSDRKEPGISLPFRQVQLDEPATWRQSYYIRFISARWLSQAVLDGDRM
jgi:hypothetical protein